MEQIIPIPTTVGWSKNKDAFNSTENRHDALVTNCPFCEKEKSFQIMKNRKHFFCNWCLTIGSMLELKALLNGDYEKARNSRRAENKKQTERNCKKYRFEPGQYQPHASDWQRGANEMLRRYRSNFRFFDWRYHVKSFFCVSVTSNTFIM